MPMIPRLRILKGLITQSSKPTRSPHRIPMPGVKSQTFNPPTPPSPEIQYRSTFPESENPKPGVFIYGGGGGEGY